MLKLTLKAPTTTTTTTPKITINLTNATSASASATTHPTTTTTLPTTAQPSAIEEHFLLRLPPSLASTLTTELLESHLATPGDLRIRFASPRTALVQHPKFVKAGYAAVLCDFPTVMETLKNPSITVELKGDSRLGDVLDERLRDGLSDGLNERLHSKPDKPVSKLNIPSDTSTHPHTHPSNPPTHTHPNTNTLPTVSQYYKVADVNQVLVVLDLDSPDSQRFLSRLPLPIQQRLRHLATCPATLPTPSTQELAQEAQLSTVPWAVLPDGLTPPLRDAQRRRFAPRPLSAGRVGEVEVVEREVERLLRADAEASETHFQLIGGDGEVLLGDGFGVGSGLDGDGEGEELGEELTLIDEEEQYSHSHSDDSDDDVMDDFAAEIEDNLMRMDADTMMEDTIEESMEESMDDTMEAQSTTHPSQSTPTHTLSSAVSELESKLQEKLKQASTVTNPLIKARIEDVIRQLEDNLRKLRSGSEGEGKEELEE